MDDAQLNSLRQEPSTAFAARLKATLDADGRGGASATARWRRPSVFAPVVGVAVLLVLLSVPSVRASAESFLALFRVVNFVAVPVDESRLAALESQQIGPQQLIGDRMEVLESSSPVGVASPEQAGTVAGFTVRVPGYLPASTVLAGVEVTGRQRARVTADNSRARALLDALSITDLEVPEALDGQVIDLTIPPVVTLKYDRGGSAAARVVQARSPELTLPSGVDLASLAEIGLRILGLPATEAREFARAVDWHTTLVVPLPASVSSFRQISIDGNPGLLVERTRTLQGGSQRRESQIVWSSDGQVYGIEGALASSDMLAMAESMK